MTTHAARTAEIFAQIEEFEERQSELRRQSEEVASKLEAARAHADMMLLLADVLGFMQDVDTRNMSEGKRVRFQGVRKRVRQQLGVAS